MRTKGSVTAYLLIILLLAAAGYLINKGIITINVNPSPTEVPTTVTTEPSPTVSTTLSEEEIFCTKKGTEEKLSLKEAKEIALQSECGEAGLLKDTPICNDVTGTWWIDLDIQKQGCSPACVINVETKEAEINWRCTGALPIPEVE